MMTSYAACRSALSSPISVDRLMRWRSIGQLICWRRHVTMIPSDSMILLQKTTYHKKFGADRICFTHHSSCIIASSNYKFVPSGESLRYLSMYDNRCLRYFKGHKERVVSLCMSPVNDGFMSGSIDHTV